MVEVERLLDELERLVINSPIHLFGWGIVNEVKFFAQTDSLRKAIQQINTSPLTDAVRREGGVSD